MKRFSRRKKKSTSTLTTEEKKKILSKWQKKYRDTGIWQDSDTQLTVV